jgi:hypothetical protein
MAVLHGAAYGASDWTDISTPLLARLTNNGAKAGWPGGCSGVVVDRLTGDITIKVVGLGLWRSSNDGQDWHRIDGDAVTGRDETGWATSNDPNQPSRMASFSLDGSAGWTTNGIRWHRFTSLGRNWDYGSVDWSASAPRSIIAARHETDPLGEVYVSRDGGIHWRMLSVRLSGKPDPNSMVGALGEGIFIYAHTNGIQRSVDGGASWSKVSDAQPQTRVPVLFAGTYYLGGTNGLLASTNRGLSWQTLGTPVNIWQGPFFGRDAREMLVVGKNGAFVTRDRGTTWTQVASLKPNDRGFRFTPQWFGCYAWDSVNNILYASSMGNPVYRLKL